MADIIKRHNFDQALRRLEQFSNSTPSVPYIKKFETDGGLLGWGNHYINGHEMNDYVEKVQDHLSKQNSIIISTIKEFREVYNTFNFLDKEYLQGIISAVDASNKASEGARTASNQAKEAAVKALKNEDDIRKEVEALKKVVEKIKTIREDLNTKISKIEKSVNEDRIILNQEVSKRTSVYSEIQTLRNGLETLSDMSQLSDKVEFIWEELEKSTERLSIIKEVVNENHKKNVSSIEAIHTATDNSLKDAYLLINQIDLKVEAQREENTIAFESFKCKSDERHLEVSQRINRLGDIVEAHQEKSLQSLNKLKRESDARHLETSQRIGKLEDTVEAQHEESSQSLNNLKRESDARHLEVSQWIDKLEDTIEVHRNEYVNLLDSLEKVIIRQKQEYTNQIDSLNQDFITQYLQLQKKIIAACIIGFLGIIGSIVAFVI